MSMNRIGITIVESIRRNNPTLGQRTLATLIKNIDHTLPSADQTQAARLPRSTPKATIYNRIRRYDRRVAASQGSGLAIAG